MTEQDAELASIARAVEEAPTQVGEGTGKGIDWLEVFGWAMFDFANSSFTTVIVTVVFPVFFVQAVVPQQTFSLLGLEVPAGYGELLYSIAGAISLLVVLVTSPFLGAVADFSASKKRFLFLSYLGCVFFTAAMYGIGSGDVALAMLLFVLAKICFSMGENFVSAFLPDIAPPDAMGKVSGMAWGLGFFGGIACLALCIPFVGQMEMAAQAGKTRQAFLVVAAFFLVAGIPTFLLVKQRGTSQVLLPGESYWSVGLDRLRTTWRQVSHLRQLTRFLGIFTVYNAGLSVVVYFTAIYAAKELGFTTAEQMTFFIAINVVAALGAFSFGVLQDRIGAKKAINLTLILWMAACVLAYLATAKSVFWVAGILAGLALGATQSGSRALVGILSPPSRSAEFFGFWGLFWKLSEAIGPLVFGLVTAVSGLRTGILFTSVFFVVGFLGMLFVDEEQGRLEALRYEEITRRELEEMAEATQIADRGPF